MSYCYASYNNNYLNSFKTDTHENRNKAYLFYSLLSYDSLKQQYAINDLPRPQNKLNTTLCFYRYKYKAYF